MARKLVIPKCLGYECGNPFDGYDYDCEYPLAGEISCEDCICNFYKCGGTRSPITGKHYKSALKIETERSKNEP